jgi:imidazolonepropionase-like amidohydrolase
MSIRIPIDHEPDVQRENGNRSSWFGKVERRGHIWRMPRLNRLALALVLAPSLQAQTKAFTGFTLIDGSGRGPIPNAVMVVRDGRIVAAGSAAMVSVPASADRVPLNGKFVIPGLINAHGHVNAPEDLRTYAAYGATTVFSLGGDQAPVFAARDAQAVSTPDRARVFVAGPVLTPRTPEEARTQVRDVAAQKVDIVKIRVDDNLGTARKMAPEVYRAVIDEAHRQGLRVAAHLFYLADAKSLLDAGADLVAHSVRDADVDAALIAAMKSKSVCLVPTLMREVSTFVYETTPSWFEDSLFLAHANREWIARLREPARQQEMRNSASAQRYKAALVVASRNMKTMHDAGVTVAMGTDTGPMGRFQGYFELMELELMAKAGMTPSEVILSATRDAARCMKADRDLGTLEPGKWADFVALDASPLENISNVRRISSVWIAGNRVSR